MMGYYRDDQPLYDLILDSSQQRELDTLWEELDFFASAPLRQYQGFLWFDRTDSRFMRDPEFDFARPEDHASLTEPMINRLADAYLAKAKRRGGSDLALQAIASFFNTINRQIRWVEKARTIAEPRHLEAVKRFASRAYRRPLTTREESELHDYYLALRTNDELPHEYAMQDIVVSILMSPHFCYRVDLLCDTDSPRPLNDSELASRLSYFLWSSLPDAELLACAERGELHTTEVLLQQTRRMMQDPANLNRIPPPTPWTMASLVQPDNRRTKPPTPPTMMIAKRKSAKASLAITTMLMKTVHRMNLRTELRKVAKPQSPPEKLRLHKG